MRKLIQLFTLAIVGLFITQSSFAQISIEGSDFLGLIGKSYSFTQANDYDTGIEVSVGNSGANQTWDFSTLSLEGEMFFRAYYTPSETPFADSFPTANMATRATYVDEQDQVVYFQYQLVDANGFTDLGIAATLDDTTFISRDEMPEPVVLPVTYETQWVDVSSDTTFVDANNYSLYRDSSVTRADGWGTLVLPSGSFEVLRLQAADVDVFQVYLNGELFSSDTTRSFTYDWVSKSDFVVLSIESLDEESDPNFTVAGFVQYVSAITTDVAPEARAGSTMLTALYPNPSAADITIEFNAAAPSVDMGIYDILGRRIHTLVASGSGNVQTVGWDGVTDAGTRAAPGMYILRIQAGDQVESRQFVLSR